MQFPAPTNGDLDSDMLVLQRHSQMHSHPASRVTNSAAGRDREAAQPIPVGHDGNVQLQHLLPLPNKLPASAYSAGKLLRPIGASYNKIPACSNDCCCLVANLAAAAMRQTSPPARRDFLEDLQEGQLGQPGEQF